LERQDPRFGTSHIELNTQYLLPELFQGSGKPPPHLHTGGGLPQYNQLVETLLYSFLIFIFAFFLLLIVGAWIRAHWADIRQKLKSPSTINSEKSKEQELLPAQFQNVSVSAAPIVLAIYNSVRRYKDLFITNLNKRYYFTARSKRYELKLTLSVVSEEKFLLHLSLEGKHPHKFSLEFTDKIPPRIRKKDSEITIDELAPFFEPLSFFERVAASPGILQASTTLNSEDSMENWPQTFSAFIRLGRYLMDSVLRKEILEATDVLCPYCRGQFSINDATVSCSECKTRHHKECWEEVDRCSVFGCRSKTEIVITIN
jgi:Prokaryotic RING finger family 1